MNFFSGRILRSGRGTLRFLMASALLFAAASGSFGADTAVVARVNGAKITAADLEAEISRLLPRVVFHGEVTPEKREALRDKALESLITAELQYQDATARGITAKRGDVKDELRKIRDRFDSKQAYKDALEANGLTEDRLKEIVERRLVIEKAIETIVKEPSRVQESAVREQYNANVQKFRQAESVKLRVMSTDFEARAREMKERLAKGDDFGAVAAALSEDKWRVKGGDAGYIQRGMLVPELEEAVFALEPGTVSRILPSQGTWFIFKVEDKRPGRTIPFEEAKDSLKKEMEQRNASELLDKWVGGLRSKADIQIEHNIGGKVDSGK